MENCICWDREYLDRIRCFENHPLIDTHAHLGDEAFQTDRAEVIRDLPRCHVEKAVCVSASMADAREQACLCRNHAGLFYTVGVHPENLEDLSEGDMEELYLLAKEKKCVAVGEIGLDYHYAPETRDAQIYWFARQMELAKELDLPVVVHQREATEDCLRILSRFPEVRCVIHCFSGSPDTARALLAMGHFISFTGALTFKNARKAPEVLKMLPSDRWMLETDSPYMCPEPFRGRRNDPRMVPVIAARAAEILDLPPTEIADRTTANAKAFFRLTEDNNCIENMEQNRKNMK